MKAFNSLIRPGWLALSLILFCFSAHAQEIGRFQTISIQLPQRNGNKLERSFRPFKHCQKKNFGFRIEGKFKRPPRDITATRIVFSISIKPFFKNQTQKL